MSSPSPAPAPAPAPSPAPAPPRSVTAQSTSSKAEEFKVAFDNDAANDIVSTLSYGVAFQGFNPSTFRATLFARGMTYSQLLVCLTCLGVSGNNPIRLGDSAKVTDADIARRALDIVRAVGVTGRKTSDNATITLARIAISFLPIYWQLRKWLAHTDRLQNQFVGSVDPVYQDPNMGAMAVLHGYESQYRVFESMFTEALAGIGPKKPITNKTDWLQVACRGLNSDELSLRILADMGDRARNIDPDHLHVYFRMYMTNSCPTAPIQGPTMTTRKVVSGLPTASSAEQKA